MKRPSLRVVGPDDRMPAKAGSLQVVLEDLAVAKGHVVEARAEAAECPEDGVDSLDAALVCTEDALDAAITQVHRMRGHL